ncbi:MAG: DUF5011 domain-containing protein [Ruminococcaceae bacterium]|nr:DUF5011 domain-containing protein [Oscillospiraceae bacterium]
MKLLKDNKEALSGIKTKFAVSEKQNNAEEGKKGFFSSFGKVHIIILSAVGALLAGILIFVLALSAPVVCEAGERPDYSRITERAVVKHLCKVESDLDAIDTSVVQETKVELKFFGFLRTRSRLTVEDTVFPVVESVNVVLTDDVEVTPELFVIGVTDATNVVLCFKDPVENFSEGEHEMTLTATDGGGNVTEFAAKLTVIPSSAEAVFEYGVEKERVESLFFSLFPIAVTVSGTDALDCGEFMLTGTNDNVRFYTYITIADTKAPTAEVSSFDIVLGETLTEGDIVKNINDHSEVKTVLEGLPDFKAPGEYEVKAILTDAFGNESRYISYIHIHDVETEITAELGCENAELSKLIFKDDFSRENLSFQNQRETRNMKVGENELQLLGKYGLVSVKVTLEDTTPPDFSVAPVSYLVGTKPKAADLVAAYKDFSDVTFSFKTAVDNSKDGTFDVTIVATDASGNTAELVGKIVFYYDTEPPVISGHRDFYVIMGETCDFSSGVTAYDAICGDVKVTVDSTKVNLNAAGAYTVTYTAVDDSGNVAFANVTVNVREPLRVCINVPCMYQRPALPNGCEVVSLSMALSYNGYSISPINLFESFMAKSPYRDGDPWTTYIGNPYVKGEGYGCFAPCVVETGNKYLSSVGASKRVYDVSGKGLSHYESLIDQGIPVLLWGTTNMSGRNRICWEAEINGKNVCWLSASHCLLLIGYTDYTYIFCDPLEGVVEYDKAAVEKSYNLNFRQACIIK